MRVRRLQRWQRGFRQRRFWQRRNQCCDIHHSGCFQRRHRQRRHRQRRHRQRRDKRRDARSDCSQFFSRSVFINEKNLSRGRGRPAWNAG